MSVFHSPKKLLATALFAMWFTHVAYADTINIATDESYPPYHDMKDGVFVGFEVDLAKEICQIIGQTCEFKFEPFEKVLPSVRFGKNDIAMSGFGVTKARQKRYIFSMPYLDDGGEMEYHEASFQGFCHECPTHLDMSKPEHKALLIKELNKSFKGKTVAFLKTSSFERFFEHNASALPKIKTLAVNETSELAEKLLKDEIAVSFGATGLYEKNQVKKYPFKVYGGEFGRGVAVVLDKQDSALKQDIDNAIKTLVKNGKIKALSLKWFKKDLAPEVE